MRVELILCKHVSDDFSNYSGVFDEIKTNQEKSYLDCNVVLKVNYDEEDKDLKRAILHIFIINTSAEKGMYLLEGTLEREEGADSDKAKVELKEILLDGYGKYEMVVVRNDNMQDVDSSDGFEVYKTGEVVDFNPRSHKGSDSNFTQNSISVLFHFYQSFPHIIFPHTARFRLLIIFCTFFLVRIAQGFPVCFHFAPKQYLAFYNVCSTDLL